MKILQPRSQDTTIEKENLLDEENSYLVKEEEEEITI